MKQSVHILYLSGFGSKYDAWRLKLLKWWRYRGVTVELVAMKWEGRETFEQKVARVDQAVDRAKGKRVVIIGESAGGSMAVHMYARRPEDFYRVMTICGKNARPETVGQQYYDRSPAFRTSMERLNKSIEALSSEQRSNFVSIHPLYDSVVSVRDTLLPGCKQVRLWTIGHGLAIASALTIFSPTVIRQARK